MESPTYDERPGCTLNGSWLSPRGCTPTMLSGVALGVALASAVLMYLSFWMSTSDPSGGAEELWMTLLGLAGLAFGAAGFVLGVFALVTSLRARSVAACVIACLAVVLTLPMLVWLLGLAGVGS